MCDRCCETCKYYRYDWSVDAAWCENDFEGEWVEQESEDYWNIGNDYCTHYEEISYPEF